MELENGAATDTHGDVETDRSWGDARHHTPLALLALVVGTGLGLAACIPTPRRYPPPPPRPLPRRKTLRPRHHALSALTGHQPRPSRQRLPALAYIGGNAMRDARTSARAQ